MCRLTCNRTQHFGTNHLICDIFHFITFNIIQSIRINIAIRTCLIICYSNKICRSSTPIIIHKYIIRNIQTTQMRERIQIFKCQFYRNLSLMLKHKLIIIILNHQTITLIHNHILIQILGNSKIWNFILSQHIISLTTIINHQNWRRLLTRRCYIFIINSKRMFQFSLPLRCIRSFCIYIIMINQIIIILFFALENHSISLTIRIHRHIFSHVEHTIYSIKHLSRPISQRINIMQILTLIISSISINKYHYLIIIIKIKKLFSQIRLHHHLTHTCCPFHLKTIFDSTEQLIFLIINHHLHIGIKTILRSKRSSICPIRTIRAIQKTIARSRTNSSSLQLSRHIAHSNKHCHNSNQNM